MAYAFGVTQHGYSRVRLDITNKIIRAAWDYEVDIIVERKERVHLFSLV